MTEVKVTRPSHAGTCLRRPTGLPTTTPQGCYMVVLEKLTTTPSVQLMIRSSLLH